MLEDYQLTALLTRKDVVQSLADLCLGDQGGQVLQVEVLLLESLLKLFYIVAHLLDVYQVVMECLDIPVTLPQLFLQVGYLVAHQHMVLEILLELGFTGQDIFLKFVDSLAEFVIR